MAKYITNEEFFNQLNSCEYGRKYIELVTNPKNHLRKKEKGENHHIHPKKLGGDLKEKSNLVRLSYFNHCLAHVLLCKAAMQLHCDWIGETKMMLFRLSHVEFRHLSELEQFTLEDIYNWSELRAEAYVVASKRQKEWYNNLTEQEREDLKKKRNDAYNNLTEEEKRNIYKKQQETYNNKSQEEKDDINRRRGESCKKSKAKRTEEQKQESIRKQKETYSKRTEEQKQESLRKHKETYSKRTEEQKAETFKKRSIGVRKALNNRTEEQKAASNRKRKETYKNRTEEQKAETRRKQQETRKKNEVGKIRIYRGKQNIMIFPNELPTYIDNGWYLKKVNKAKLARESENRIMVCKIYEHKQGCAAWKWILPEDLPFYIADGWYQKSA